jgi:hypothetical protein
MPMSTPLPPDHDAAGEDLPLRHRPTRAREAERIRQEFVRSRKSATLGECDASAKEMVPDES